MLVATFAGGDVEVSMPKAAGSRGSSLSDDRDDDCEKYDAEEGRPKCSGAAEANFTYPAVDMFHSIRHPIPGVAGTVRIPELGRA